MFIDLGGSYFVDHIRILHAVSNPPPFRAYRIQLSDGSTNAGAELAWRTVGSISDVSREQTFHGFDFPLTKTEHLAFTYRLNDKSTYEPGQGGHGVSEIQFFGEGFLAESQISSEFGGESPFIELGRTPQNLASIEWEADEPSGTDLILQTRTGDTICATDAPILLESIDAYEPVISQAVEPATLREKEKLEESLKKLADEDPTFQWHEDEGTGQTIIRGMGELHLEILADRIQREFGLEVKCGKPTVLYMEALRGSAEAEADFERSPEEERLYGAVRLRVGAGDELRL